MEVEHRADGISDAIKRSMSDALAAEPVIFDEANHRGLIGGRMIHEVMLCPRRNNKQRLPRTVSAPALCVRGSRIEAGQRCGAVSAASGTSESISWALRSIHDLAELVIVPSVGI